MANQTPDSVNTYLQDQYGSTIPQVSAPDPANYQLPGADQLQNQLNQLQNAKPVTADLSQADDYIKQQQQYLQGLQDQAAGKTQSLAEQQTDQALQIANAQAQGAAQSARGLAPAAAIRQSQLAQAQLQAQGRAAAAQVAAQQRQAALAQSAALQGSLSNQAIQEQQLQTSTAAANQAFAVNVLGQRLNIAGLVQGGNIALSQQQQQYQQFQQQQYIQSQQFQNQQSQQLFGSILQAVAVVGAAALTVGTGGAAAPLAVGAVGAVIASQH